jgi:predicted ATP-binding protein involved in virulence
MTNQPKTTRNKRKSTSSDTKETPAYFLSLEVENIFCFKERQKLKISDKNGYPAKWTVILGDNGVGKTTLLRCLAVMEMRLDPSPLPHIEEKSYLPILYSSYGLTHVWKEAERLEYGVNLAEVCINFVSNIPLTSFKLSEDLEIQKNYVLVKIGGDSRMTGGGFKGLICYGYGATRRMGETLLRDRISSENSASLFSDNATLVNAEEWLLQTDYAIKSSSGKPHNRFKKEFNIIIESLKQILPDVKDIRIAPADELHSRPRAEFSTSYGWVQLSSLGLGYRTTIAWMVDLAVRLFKRYPDSEDPLAEPAIVLVDEIDLHMHPKWQRDIMQFLTDRFPNTQFIVTAHSPLVVQAAQDANIVLLRQEGDRVVIDNNPEIIENWRVDQVLTSVFEMPSARPAKIEPLLQRRKELLTKPKLTASDRAELKELEAKIGTLPTAETSEDIKAMDIIRRAAKLLDQPVTEAVE